MDRSTHAITSSRGGELLQLPGTTGQIIDATFTLSARLAKYRSEVGLYRVDDAGGRIGNLSPGQHGHALAALQRHTVLFLPKQQKGAVAKVELAGGNLCATYLIQNSSSATFLNLSLKGHAPQAFFSFQKANADKTQHVRQSSKGILFFEDMTGGGDRDFNDVIVNSVYKIKPVGIPGAPPDTTPPELVISAPIDGLLTVHDVTVIGQAADDKSGVSTVSMSLASPGSSPSSLKYVTIPFDAKTATFQSDLGLKLDGSADGSYTVFVHATDKAGNTSTDKSVRFTLDTTAPALSISLDPASDTDPVGDDQTTNSIVTLDGQTEPNLTVTLVETGAKATADGSGHFAFTGVALAVGANVFHAQAIDLAGNAGSTSRTITRTQTDCVFNDLTGWTIDQQGGSTSGKGTAAVAGDRVVIREGDSFHVALEHTFVIPAGATSLSFDYADLSFDTSSIGTIKDAFEASLLDSSGQSLVHTIRTGRDAFFNITEGTTPALGSEATVSGQTVTLNLSG